MTARRIGSRPGSLPVISKAHNAEPIPVPTQKAAYAAIQNSLIHSKATDDRNSISAMSGVSSASGGSILGPLPEEECVPATGGKAAPSPALLRRPRCSSMSSPINSLTLPTNNFQQQPKHEKSLLHLPEPLPPPILFQCHHQMFNFLWVLHLSSTDEGPAHVRAQAQHVAPHHLV